VARALEKKSRKTPVVVKLTGENLVEWLGPPRFNPEAFKRIEIPGVVVGLAWTQMGGEILFIEATHLEGSGQIKLTGQMGEVMLESATIAWTIVKKRLIKEKFMTSEQLKKTDVHLHIPAGAIPKDGPSAGITMCVALYSAFTGKKIRNRLAMTGEISLTENVLPVGGIKEKLLAAKRSGINNIILPKMNEKDLSEIPSYAVSGMKIEFVERLSEVLDLCLQKQKKRPK